MSVDIRFHPAAEQELRSAYFWYLERNRIVADAFRLEAEHAVEVIAESPDRWPRVTETERRYVFPRYPFSLIYRKVPGFIEVIAVAHHKRKPGFWAKRRMAT